MKSFLDKTAEYVITNFEEDIDRICIVLPNRRAGLFLKRSLAVTGKKKYLVSSYLFPRRFYHFTFRF